MAQTQLTPSAIPGRSSLFSPKGSEGAGPFTALSVLGCPGMRHVFDAKNPAIILRPRLPDVLGGGYKRELDRFDEMQLAQIRRDDEEILDVLIQVIILDIL